MNHQKMVSIVVGVSILTASFAQTKVNTKDGSHRRESTEQMRLESVNRAEIHKSTPIKKDKEINLEIPITSGTDIFLDNNNRNIEIKTWDLPKVKITAYPPAQQENVGNKSSITWFEQMNITTKMFGKTFTIKTAAFNGYSNSLNAANGTNNENYENYETNSNKKIITIYVPKANKLSIESKYGDVAVKNFIRKLNADITNGNLDLENVNTLILRSKYSNININQVEKGEIDFINGKLSIQNIDDGEFDTKYSTVEIANAKKITLKSTNDNYEFDNIGSLEGFKNYGTLRISNLQEAIQLDGTNADIKVKNIEATVNTILIDNKYADLRLPLKKVRNFSLSYDGTYSTIYKNFAIEYNNNLGETNESKITTGDVQNSKFKAVAGNGKDAAINIKCQNCTVDFR